MKFLICLLSGLFIGQPALSEQALPLTEEIRGLAENTESEILEEEDKISTQEAVEKIKVTGSRIKRIDMEGPSPITIFNKEDLENSGYSSVADFLRDTTISSKGVFREKAGSAVSGESFISIKGEESLILINGLRVTEDPDAHAVDLNLIPMNAIERIEVLKDGGSALYGSDAIGGVINFITKKDFDGIEVHGTLTPTLYPLYRGDFKKGFDDYFAGSQANAGAVFGNSGKNWSYIGTLNAHYRVNIISHQRQWGKEMFSPVSPYVVFFTTEDRFIHTTCPPENQTSDKKGCKFDYTPYADFSPKYFQVNSFIQGEYNTGNLKFYSQFLASYKKTQYYFAPLPVYYASKPELVIPNNHKMSVAQGQEVKLSHRFMKTGRRNMSAGNWFVDLTAGIKGYLSNIWDYDFSIKGSHIIKNHTEKNILLKDKVISAIVEGKYDPVKPTKKGLSEAIYTAKGKSSSSLLSSSLDFSGEGLWDLNLATGFQAYFQNYTNKEDPQQIKENILSGVGSDGKGNRYVASYYIEAVKNFNESLELQMAWRADYYSDFGLSNFGIKETFNIDSDRLQFLDYLIGTPKLAFRFQPHSDILLRGSVGTSFKAPNLSSLYGSSSRGYPWMIDTVGCIAKLNKLSEAELTKQRDNNINTIKSSPNLSDEQKNAQIKNISDNFPVLVENLAKIEKNTNLIKDIVIYNEQVTSQSKLSKENKKLITEQKLVEAASLLYGSTDSACYPKQYIGTVNSNEDLQETRALITSVGSVLEVTPDLNLSIDLSYIKKTGIPSSGLSDSDGLAKKVFDMEALHGSQYLKEKYDILIERDSEKLLQNITTKQLNLQKSQKLFYSADDAVGEFIK